MGASSRLIRIRFILVAMLGSVLLTTPVSAGGWAVVELDQPLAQVPIGEPVRIGYMVLQHGERPFEGAITYLSAIHRETGEEVRAEGKEEGEIGHYVVEVVFPAAGEWKWSITPEPFGDTLLPPVIAVAPGQLAAHPDLPAVPEEEVVHPADVVRGGCWPSAPLAYTLDDVAPRTPTTLDPKDATADAPVVKESETVLPVALTELADGVHAVAIRAGDAAGAGLVACGEILGESLDGALIVGLRETDGSGYVGFARLAEDAEPGQTTVTIYLARDLAAPVAPAGVPITIDDLGFNPPRLEITAGSTVSWTNAGAIVHTVASEDLAFDDSGILRPGDSFSQTFDEPGVYSYRCGPHAFMTATIVVM